MSQEPSRYVQPSITEARVARLWQNVSERLPAPRRSYARYWLWAPALAGLVAVLVLWQKSREAPSPAPAPALADAQLETKNDELKVTLADGSRLQVAAQSSVRVQGNQASAVALALTRGVVTCDVTHREGRSFTVVAHDVTVRVVGTRFSVKTTSEPQPRVEVSVSRGVVEITSTRRPGIVARVAAGQSWSSELPSTGFSAAAPVAVVAPSVAVSAPEPKREPPPPPTARELFEKAGESRRSGDAKAAANAYAELLRLHPSDGRAGLAAFELGRLRMDRLGDAPGAISALERAVAMNIGPSFREDALARLVSAYAAQGNAAACARARDRYLSSYPAGVHASAVQTRCGSR